MAEQKSFVVGIGGYKRMILLTVVGVATIIYGYWQESSSSDALQEVGAKLGLQFVQNHYGGQLRGHVDEIDITVNTTSENSQGDSKHFTDFQIDALGQPDARILGAHKMQSVIDSMTDLVQGTEYLNTGDKEFDDDVLIAGDLQVMLARLDAEARTALKAATDAGWKLENRRWTVRKSGLMNDPQKIESILESGIAAARALAWNSEVEVGIQDRAENDPVPGVREVANGILERQPARTESTVTLENASKLLNDLDESRSLEAALVLSSAGNASDDVKVRLLSAFYTHERKAEVIVALGKVGGSFEASILSTVDDEHRQLAQKAISEIEQRLETKE